VWLTSPRRKSWMLTTAVTIETTDNAMKLIICKI
jgi:hypothetical protein